VFVAVDVLVLPSLVEGSFAVVYEAFSAGVLVFHSRSGGAAVLDHKERRFVSQRDPEAIVDAVESIVEDCAVRASMSLRAV
jgi:glycosyltransferase involved in cell wall biosynthesis